jgi:HEAT repeat protein
VNALGASGDERAVDPLLGAWDYLKSVSLQLGELPPNLQIMRERILEALSRIGGKRATALLEEQLNSSDRYVVEAAVRGIGRLQDRKALPVLQRLAGSGGDMTQAVFEAFADIGDKRAVSVLEAALKAPDKFMQVEAAYALSRLGEKKKMVARLEDSLRQDPGSEKVGLLAAYYLAKLDYTSGLDHLVRLMDRPDSPWAAVAAESLGKSGNERAVLPLTAALKSRDSSVRLSAARSLGLLGGTRAVSALRKVRDDPNPGVRNAALSSLMELGEAD